MEKMYKVSEVAKLFDVSRQMVSRWIEEGKISAIILGEKTRRIPESELEKLKKQRG